MGFKLRRLEQFVAVAEELHFGRAAERLGTNEGPLSKAMTQLEKRLGAHLFIRTPRSTRLTALGKAFLVDARRILADIEKAQNTLTTTVSGRRGRLRVGFSDGMAHPRIAKMMLEIQREEPLLELKTFHLRSEDQGQAFMNDRLDLGFITA